MWKGSGVSFRTGSSRAHCGLFLLMFFFSTSAVCRWASPRGWAPWCCKRAVSIIRSACFLFLIHKKIESFLNYLTEVLRFVLFGPFIGSNLGHLNQYLWWGGGLSWSIITVKLSLKLMEGFTPPKNMAAVESMLGRRQIFCYRYSGKQWIQSAHPWTVCYDRQ